MDEHLKVKLSESVWLNALPLFLGGLGSFLCGQSAAFLARRMGGIGKQRRTVSIIGFFGASVLIFLATRLNNPVAVMFSIGFASFCNDLAMPPSWGAAMDLGGRYAGTVAGAMNMIGNLGGSLASLAIPLILQMTNNDWNMPLYVASVIYFTGAFIWMMLDPVTPLHLGEVEAHAAIG
jgi:hypothetical protein